MAEGKYKTVVIDPPWDYGKLKPRKEGLNGRGGQAQMHYETLSVDELKSFDIQQFVSDPCFLFLWVTNPKMKYGFDLLASWGFNYQTTLTWVKTAKNGSLDRGGMGFYFRGATEHVLFATKGKCLILPNLRKPNVIFAGREGHSVKPEAMYRLIESVTPSPRIDIFARKRHEGFDAWGNQVEPQMPLFIT